MKPFKYRDIEHRITFNRVLEREPRSFRRNIKPNRALQPHVMLEVGANSRGPLIKGRKGHNLRLAPATEIRESLGQLEISPRHLQEFGIGKACRFLWLNQTIVRG